MAVRHIVMWTLTGDDAEKEEAATQITERLEALTGVVPGILSLTVRRNAAFHDVNYDIVLVSVHEDVQALKEYQLHPEHQKTAEYIRSVAQQRASIDIEA